MAKKYSKNLQRVQDMVDGKYQRKIQSGYSKVEEEHKVGDKWTDSDGVEWEQKDGYRTKISKLDSGFTNCPDCGKFIVKSYDKETFTRNQRCYHCQITFELDLKCMRIGKRGNKWQFWVKLQELKRWIAVDDEVEHLIFENDDLKKTTFDETVANALANENVSMTVKKNMGG